MLNCRDVTERASDYLDQSMSRLDRLKILTHLMICQHCRRYVEQMNTVITLVREMRLNKTSEQHAEDVVTRILKSQSDEA